MSQVIERCDALAKISDNENLISRVFLEPSYKEGLLLVESWMHQEGLQTHFDQVANLWGRRPSLQDDAATLILGSHLDTVPNAGRFDGILGVMVALEVVNRLNKNGVELPFHLDVVGIGDEEGVSFNASMLGSKAIVGGWNDTTLELMNSHGIMLEEALISDGFDAENYQKACRAGDKLIGYWEVHMEQGPVLQDEYLPVGVVTAIAGARRLNVTIEGEAGHAGTVPMHLRQDALAAAAEVILMIEKHAIENGLVATVGQLRNFPNAVNVIPGTVQFTLDIRSENDALRETVMNRIFSDSEGIAEQRRHLAIYWNEYHWAPATQCHPDFQQLFAKSIEEQQLPVRFMPSGAGHDAMTMAAITDVAMLFVRCKDGISHHPDEDVTAEDAEVAVETLYRSVLKLAECYQ